MLSRIWSRYFRTEKANPAGKRKPVQPERTDGTSRRSGNSSRSPRGGIEMLEGRIAPAILLNPSTISYVDKDGDQVVIKFSKPLFTQTGTDLIETLNSVFKFSGGTVVPAGTPDPGAPQQLQIIDLTKLDLVGPDSNPKSPAAGISFTITAEKADTLQPKPDGQQGEVIPGPDGTLDGDGFANVGAIIASTQTVSFGLGKVTIDGDLGQIDVGSANSRVAIAALKVHSFGVATDSQPSNPSGGFPNFESKIIGSLGSLIVETDVKGVHINVVNGGGFSKTVGKIGSVTIGGTLEGSTTENSGVIQSATTIGKVKIGSGQIGVENQTDDGIKGGAGKNSGAIVAGKIDSIEINGDLVGGAGENSGSIRASVIGKVAIGTGLENHGIIGGGGRQSGTVQATSQLKSIVIDGSLIGGAIQGGTLSAENSGAIIGNGTIGKILISGDIVTADSGSDSTAVIGGLASARIYAAGGLGSVTVEGTVKGGTREGTGVIESGTTIKSVKIGEDLIGGAGAGSGGILAKHKLSGVVIGGSVIGGTGETTGFIQSELQIGSVKITQDLKGNETTTAKNSGVIFSGGAIADINIGGSLIGSKGDSSASIHAALNGTGTLEKVTIGKQLLGGEGFGSAAITSGSKIGFVTINGAGSEIAVQGGKGNFSASIFANGTIKSVKITGDVKGGEGNDSASIQSTGLLSAVTINGDLLGGKGIQSGSILSHDIWEQEIAGDLGKLNITGALKAGEGARSGRIAADGNLASLTLGSMDVGEFATGAPGAGSCTIATGLGAVHLGDTGTISVNGSMNGRGGNHSLLEIRGALGSLSARDGIQDGDIHIDGNLGKLTVGVLNKRGVAVAANIDNVILTAGGITPATAKAATAIASITVTGNVSDSQFLAGYNLTGQGTNADAQIGAVKISGNWTASDLVAGVKAVDGFFGNGNDAAIEGGSETITSRIASVIIGGSVTGTSEVTTDSFGFVAQQIGTVKVGGKVITPNTPNPALPNDVNVVTTA